MASTSSRADVVVVGGGIVGAAITYHLAAAGVAVTLLDGHRPGSGVTADSFAWIGSSGVRGGPAAELRRLATADYRRLEGELPHLAVRWSGSLSWVAAGAEPAIGPGQELVDADGAAELEPALLQPPERALWAAGDGAVDPVVVTERLVDAARPRGADVVVDTPVVGLRRDGAGRVVGVDTATGFVAAGMVVLAAGVATAALAATAGVQVPVAPSPATLVRFAAPSGLVRTVVTNNDFDLRQTAADRLIAAADSPTSALAAVRRTFRGAAEVELLGSRIGARPMPVDGEPIIGPVANTPGLYLAVMHSAVTLAAAVGRLVTTELVSSAADPLLAGCRLDRFT